MTWNLCGWKLAGDGRMRPVYPVPVDGEVVWHFRDERGAPLEPVDWEPDQFAVMQFAAGEPESAFLFVRAVYWNEDGTCPWPNANPTGGIELVAPRWQCALYTPPPERRQKTPAEIQREIAHHYNKTAADQVREEIRCSVLSQGMVDRAEHLRSLCDEALSGLDRSGHCGEDVCEDNAWGHQQEHTEGGDNAR